jgi:hypothetical protein
MIYQRVVGNLVKGFAVSGRGIVDQLQEIVAELAELMTKCIKIPVDAAVLRFALNAVKFEKQIVGHGTIPRSCLSTLRRAP